MLSEEALLTEVSRPKTAFDNRYGADTKDEWLTPPEIIEALGGWESFDLDPCAPIIRPWECARGSFTKEDDGLKQEWHGRVWMNPPYQTAERACRVPCKKATCKKRGYCTPVDLPGTDRWVKRLALHGQGTALIFARTETETFFPWVWDYAGALLFIKGRLTFHHVTGERARANAGAPSMLVAYGGQDVHKLKMSGIEGRLVIL